MDFVIATNEDRVRWYVFRLGAPFELLDILDLKRVSQYPTKDAAKEAALAAGLKTWRYVRL